MTQTYEQMPAVPPDRLRFNLRLYGPGPADQDPLSSVFIDVHEDEFRKTFEQQMQAVQKALEGHRARVAELKAAGDPQWQQVEASVNDSEAKAWDYASQAAALNVVHQVLGTALREARAKGAKI